MGDKVENADCVSACGVDVLEQIRGALSSTQRYEILLSCYIVSFHTEFVISIHVRLFLYICLTNDTITS